MLLFRLWIPRYPSTPTEPVRRRGGIPLRELHKLVKVWKAEPAKKPVETIKEVEIERPESRLVMRPAVVAAPSPSQLLAKLEAKIFDLTVLIGLEDAGQKQEQAILAAIRNREEEDLLLMLLLES